MRRLLPIAVVLACSVALAPAADATTRGAPRRLAARPEAVYARPGPFAAGVTTLTIGDRETEVWYPAPRRETAGRHRDVYEIAKWLPQALQDLVASKGVKAPFTTDAYRGIRVSARGPFPLVVFAHGAGGYRDQSTFLTTHLASWGFVVTSPDFLERGLGATLGAAPATPRSDSDVIGASIAAVRRAAAGRGPLSGAVRPRGQVGIVGHSAGGRSAIEYAAQPNVRVYIPLAGAAAAFRDLPAATPPPSKPSLYMAGANDTVVPPAGIRSFYAQVPAPKRLVVIDGVGHLNAMSDICEIGKGGGGVVKLAQDAGLPVPDSLVRLGTDGCFAPNQRSRRVWPITRHFVVAELRYAFRITKRPIGLQPGIVRAFLPIEVSYTSAPPAR